MRVPPGSRLEVLKEDTALRLAKFFEGTTPGFWINMQTRYDLEEKERAIEDELKSIHGYKEVCAIA